MAASVRFAEVLKAGGQPKFYLPLVDPRTDRSFMRAVRERRVMSLKQTPTGTRKDYGVIGPLWEKYVSYLIFPKSLARFESKRVIGIKYEQIEEAPITTPPARKPRKPAGAEKKAAAPSQPAQKVRRPRPKQFGVRVQITATKKTEIHIEAFTRREARERAIAAGRGLTDFSGADITIRAAAVRERSE